MNQARKLSVLILLGVAMLVLSILVYTRRSNLDEKTLATIGILGGLAVVVVSLPTNGKKNGQT